MKTNILWCMMVGCSLAIGAAGGEINIVGVSLGMTDETMLDRLAEGQGTRWASVGLVTNECMEIRNVKIGRESDMKLVAKVGRFFLVTKRIWKIEVVSRDLLGGGGGTAKGAIWSDFWRRAIAKRTGSALMSTTTFPKSEIWTNSATRFEFGEKLGDGGYRAWFREVHLALEKKAEEEKKERNRSYLD